GGRRLSAGAPGTGPGAAGRTGGSAARAPCEDAPAVGLRALPPAARVLAADAGRLVDVGVFAEVRHDLFGEALHHLERLLVAGTGHPRAEDARLELVGEHAQLVA